MPSAKVSRPKQSRSSKHENSIHTASTASNSSEDMPPSNDVNGKKMQRRRRSRSSKSSGRDMLMSLIAKEMTNTWLDEEEAPKPASRRSSGSMSAEEIFYAQMNGEAIDHDPEPQDEQGPSLLNESDDNVDFEDDCSFGGLTLPENVRATPSELEATRRSSIESGSKGSSRGGRSSANQSSSKKSVQSLTSHTSRSGETTLSMEEIQKYVMESMPVEVRDKIPQEAWAQIFGKSSPDKTRKPANYNKTIDEERAEEKDDSSVDEERAEEKDDSSVVSDITEYTEHPQAGSETSDKGRVLSPEEVDWDEEVCPGLDTGGVKVPEIDTKSKTSQGSAKNMKDATGSVKPPIGLSVSFSHVQVRYYERILDINPAVTSGPAIGIGWRYKRGGTLPVDDWELQRGGNLRRSTELILPRPIREQILFDAGYEQKQLAEAVRIIRKAKDRRKVTVQNLDGGAEAMEESVETAVRKIKGILTFGRKKGLVKSY